MAAPLVGEAGPFGALTIYTTRPDAWAEPDAALLVAIADQAAITITTTRLIEELDRSREALGRRAEAEQALREIAARITVLREPAEILQDVVEQAGRLVRADGAILDLLDPATGNLHWAYDDGFGEQFTDEERAEPVDLGRRRRDRDGRRRGPRRRRRRRPRQPVPAVTRVDRRSTSGPGSTR